MNLQLSDVFPQALTKEEGILDRCQRARELEMNGDYAAAKQALGDLYPVLGVRPNVSSLPPASQAEVLLRAGTLCGWLGGANQVEQSQEVAKDLISESRGIFEKLNLTEKAVEASNDLAICYWREGAYDEARATLQHGLSQLDQSKNTETKLRTLLNLAVIERSSLRYKDALKVNREAAKAFAECTNHSLLGKFHNEYASVLKNIGLGENREDYIDQAIVEYSAASFHLEQVGHKHFQGAIENNQGLLFLSIGKFSEAHEHLSRAKSLFLSLGDRGSVAQVDETRAKLLLAEGKNAEAETVVRSSVRTLQKGDQRALLAEALTTHGKSLARLDRREESRTAFKRAVEVAEQVGDPETAGIAALTAVEELQTYLGIEARQLYQAAESLLTKTQDLRIKQRLGQCARLLLASASYSMPEFASAQESDWFSEATEAGRLSLEESVLRYEGELIKRALETSNGSVTKAARLLGITHQGLAFILNGRQKHLLAVRTPVRPRRRSIIRYRQ